MDHSQQNGKHCLLLTDFNCKTNNLNSLDVTNNRNLTGLNCDNNSINSLSSTPGVSQSSSFITICENEENPINRIVKRVKVHFIRVNFKQK